MIKISPSILSADFSRLCAEVNKIESAGANFLHIDVMDGHFVPNLTLGAPVIKSLRKVSDITFDVHLMIDNPSPMLDSFIEAGADIVTFHLEAAPEPQVLIDRIRKAGKKPSISIKPATAAEKLFPYLDSLSMVLVMTVEPGFGGQPLIDDCLKKAEVIRNEAIRRGIDLDIEADGGINTDTVTRVAASGVNVLVAGSFVFGAKDPAAAVKTLREKAGAAGNAQDMPWLY